MLSTPQRKVIYDTDPGVDDAMALYFALAHPGIHMVGITTTFGNVDVAQATANALYLTALAQRSIPVAQGAAIPWHKVPEPPPAYIHGTDGLGNLPMRHASTGQVDPRSAAQFIVDMVRSAPGEITLVAVGPLGNLALALQLEPALPRLVREVILMGGTVQEPGNVTPVAEANIWSDPHAADHVFAADWKLTMVGLDVTHRVVTPLHLFQRIADHHRHRATDTLHHAVAFYATFYSARHPHIAPTPSCFAHDVLAFIYLVEPELFKTVAGEVRVVTEGPDHGQTRFQPSPLAAHPPKPPKFQMTPMSHEPHEPNQTHEPIGCQVCMEVDASASLALLEATLMGDWLSYSSKE